MKWYFFSKLSYKALCFLMFIDLLKITFAPSVNLIFWCGAAILLDLMAGIINSLVQGNFVVSKGLRKTLVKLSQYMGIMILLFIFTNVFTYDPEATRRTLSVFGKNSYSQILGVLSYINNLVLMIMIYTELLSVLENLIQIDANSVFSKYILRPLHYLFSFAIVNNPFQQVVKKLGTLKNDTKTNNT